MVTDKNNLSFGYYLKTARCEKGISLESISEKIKVGKNIILLIENEDHGKLPPVVFVKGFLRVYSDAVGVDCEKIIQNYLSSYHSYMEAVRSEFNRARSRKRFLPFLFVPVGAMAVIFFFTVFFFSPEGEYAENKKTDDAHSSGTFQKSKPDEENIKDQSQGDRRSKILPKTISLKILTLGTTWMKIIIDDQAPRNYNLQPGDQLSFEAFSGFNILIGDAGTVRLSVNDKPFKMPGQSGRTVNIQIP